MNLIKKLLLTTTILLSITLTTLSQSSWQSGQYYAYKGQTFTEWRWVNVGWDGWGNPITRKQCRQSYWHQEWRQGYVYIWGPNGWYSEWRQGNFWYFTWSNWYLC
jgi:hypothetical protein